MMQSVRKRLSIILMVCIVASVILSAIFVNIAMNNTFNKYMTDVQNQRNERIVQYFQQVYKKNGKWSKNSGEELMHEAYMSNYCLTLLDNNKNVIWGMDPKDIKDSGNSHTMMLGGAGKGVYTSKTFDINVDGKTVGYAEVGQYYAVLLTEQDINFKNSINKGIAVSALITIIIAAILSLTISKQFSRPIKRVSDTSVKLSNGDYESRTNIKSNIIEINNLIQSTNMLGEKLKVQDLLRKRLVSDLSHEIRTPLNVLQNNLEAMIDGVLPNTPERLNSLNDEVIRFGKLLNNLNSLKQFESKDAEIKFDTVFLDELLAGVCEDFRLIANEKNIKIIFKRQPKKYMILADEDKLRQVFINLISNAVKFNKGNGCVWVNIEEIKDKYVVKIQDNGIGIKKEDLPYIFERLYRGDKSRQQVPGSGVGLTIVKQILNLHSASIEVTSEENTGTTFTVNFNKIA
jgi:two-component system, OmpR family, sensor histidine kinase BaeS